MRHQKHAAFYALTRSPPTMSQSQTPARCVIASCIGPRRPGQIPCGPRRAKLTGQENKQIALLGCTLALVLTGSVKAWIARARILTRFARWRKSAKACRSV
ncbi:hypothetical protein BJX62DRAFT_207901 [Aspergillus germanicus]